MQLFLMWLYDLRGDSIARIAAGADTLLWLSEANPNAASDKSGEQDEDEEKHCQEWHAFFDASFLESLIVLLISILVTLLECLIWIFYFLF